MPRLDEAHRPGNPRVLCGEGAPRRSERDRPIRRRDEAHDHRCQLGGVSRSGGHDEATSQRPELAGRCRHDRKPDGQRVQHDLREALGGGGDDEGVTRGERVQVRRPFGDVAQPVDPVRDAQALRSPHERRASRPVSDQDQLDPMAFELFAHQDRQCAEEALQALSGCQPPGPAEPEPPGDRRPRLAGAVPDLRRFDEARDDSLAAHQVPSDDDPHPPAGQTPGEVVGEADRLRRQPQAAPPRDRQRASGHVAEPRHARATREPCGEQRVGRRNLDPGQIRGCDRSTEEWRVRSNQRWRVPQVAGDAVERRCAHHLEAGVEGQRHRHLSGVP